ncbi:hypothetical protein ACHHYP_17323 [Achlya hypogyna]|uniref:FYVE-type domain-containing protein n=1 Tax=Achlya hypogyna TaxID=1202772 RepID=A0A1V9Y4N9_ACHHY|nr:hypothetical protein ACHHYP_17323 [Achlya hypogyna]
MEILDEHIVPTLTLTAADVAAHRELMREKRAKVLTLDFRREVATGRGWSLEDDKFGVQIFAKPLAGAGVSEYICHGTLPTTVPNLVEALYADDSAAQKLVDSILLESDFINAGVLSALETRTKLDPGLFLGLKYTKFSIPMSSTPRDVCFLEHSGTTTGAKGEHTFFVLRESVAVPSFPEAKGTLRAATASSYVFAATQRGDVEVTMRWFLDPSGTSLLLHQGASKVRAMLLRIATLPQFRRVVTSPLSTSWVPDAERKMCSICNKRFNALRSKHHCRLCGEIMCSGCTTKVLYVPACASQKVTGKYCGDCIQQAKGPAGRPPKDSKRKGSAASTVASGQDIDDSASEASSVRSMRSVLSTRSMHSIRENSTSVSSVSSATSSQGTREAAAATAPIETGFVVCEFKDGVVNAVQGDTAPSAKSEVDV